ncbi:MAG: MarR family transcriptional regulator [Bacteroidales bacterium]|nr:MarR family transcriptional regulator [Bacteroidales bacterium]
MSNKYDNIRQLIFYWQEYESENESTDYKKFAQWLLQNSGVQKDSNLPELTDDKSNHPETLTFLQGMDLKQRISILLIRISRFYDSYTKKFFYGLPINTQMEFQFLLSINKIKSPTKSDIVNMHLVEYTTGIDIIKRLIKLDLVEESKDIADKRSKQLKITSEGKKTLIEALIRVKKINDLLFINMNENKQDILLHMLMGINKFHTKVFLENSNKTYIELLELVESLND